MVSYDFGRSSYVIVKHPLMQKNKVKLTIRLTNQPVYLPTDRCRGFMLATDNEGFGANKWIE